MTRKEKQKKTILTYMMMTGMIVTTIREGVTLILSGFYK